MHRDYRLKVYIAMVSLLTLGGLIWLVTTCPLPRFVDVLFIVGLSIGGDLLRVPIPSGGSVSVCFAIDFAAILIFGSVSALMTALAVFLCVLVQSKPIKVAAFDASQVFLSTLAAALTYQGLGGGFAPSIDLVRSLIPLLAATFAYFVVNTLLVAVVITLDQGISVGKIWRANIKWVIPNYLALSPLGILIAIIYTGPLGPPGTVLLLMPLFLARYSFQQYSEMRKAHIDTVKALAAALDAKDSYTRGHSDRIEQISNILADAMDLSGSEIETISYAGLLHDIGKIGVSEAVLNKPGKLSEAEFNQIKAHPDIGADMIKDVGFLKGVAEIIRHHHERYDGKGYPAGLAGEDIPLGARILACADAFDAMTSDRVYRRALSFEQAKTELIENRGKQFDPRVIEVFLKSEKEIRAIVSREHKEDEHIC